ncbi:MAG: CBS domain-containing protein [Candidatus Woesearchaeota archaeon]
MSRELHEIKLLRKRMDMTQNELAKRSGVSQSMLAKIESGVIDPSYTKACAIFAVLDNALHGRQGSADDVMNKKVIWAKPSETLHHVVSVMKKHGISQLPVMENNQVVGLVSERILLESLLSGKKKIVEEVMSDRPPAVSKNASVDVVSRLLVHFPMVIVYDKRKVVGLVTKADILARI